MASIRASKMWKSAAARSALYGGRGRTVHPSFVIDACGFKLACSRALCSSRISPPFLCGRTLVRLFYKVLKEFWMYRSELMVWACDKISIKVIPYALQKTVTMISPAEGVPLTFWSLPVTWCTSRFNIQHLYVVFMCFVFIWEQTATCATYSINWLVFITEMKSVYCAVPIGSLNKAVCASYLKG